ncbi:MAG TPA: PHB depolymerase family esterase [Candidatus Limiplasma sp.]|nr:PHB depolymerase family esterase [Candidatus Limiplasma sp.]
MSLFYKTLTKLQRSLYLYFPGEENRTPFKRCSLTVLMDDVTQESVEAALRDLHLQELADQQELILSFPVPVQGGWNASLDPAGPDDVMVFRAMQDALAKVDDAPLPVNAIGIPTLEAMLSTWHPMNDTKYVLGIGSGADMALTLAATSPDNLAAVVAVQGTLYPLALEQAAYAPMPVWLCGCDQGAAAYFCRANLAALVSDSPERAVFENTANPLQQVRLCKQTTMVNADLLKDAWETLFSQVRRPNTGAHGDIEPRIPHPSTLMECHVEETVLPDGLPHTWFLHVPASVKANPAVKAPLMMFFHGGSDNPAEAAEMTKFHELGEAEGFITCYPWGTDRCGWNSSMMPDLMDDVAFSAQLIDYLIEHYPVDKGRVYLSGFSNGAAQAMAVALAHPEKIAAICPIDSNWPGKRGGYMQIDYADIIPFAKGMERKQDYDYRMPVWYTYGTREPSYPVYRYSTQHNQYDYWKQYNHIPVSPTPEIGGFNPSGCGVTGDISETLTPSARHPHHAYDVQRFMTAEEPRLNLYNYVIMRDKGHDVAQMDPALGWSYVRRFRREADGSLTVLAQ